MDSKSCLFAIVHCSTMWGWCSLLKRCMPHSPPALWHGIACCPSGPKLHLHPQMWQPLGSGWQPFWRHWQKLDKKQYSHKPVMGLGSKAPTLWGRFTLAAPQGQHHVASVVAARLLTPLAAYSTQKHPSPVCVMRAHLRHPPLRVENQWVPWPWSAAIQSVGHHQGLQLGLS